MARRIVLVDDDEQLAELLGVNFELDDRFELVGWAGATAARASTSFRQRGRTPC